MSQVAAIRKLASPLGVAAGPLLSSDWVALAASRGFDCLTYKTIRSHYHAGHGLPNIVHLQVDKQLPAFGPACQEVLFATDKFPPPFCCNGKSSNSNCRSSTTTPAPKSGAPEDSLASITTGSGDDHADDIDAVRAAGGSGGGDKNGDGGRGGGGNFVPLTITNSFGMPSLGPEELLVDIPRAAAALSPGQMMAVSIT
ncbi:hypothetical protein VOLCADRAFT_121702, partial [Volvox carteri f. nagariensis]